MSSARLSLQGITRHVDAMVVNVGSLIMLTFPSTPLTGSLVNLFDSPEGPTTVPAPLNRLACDLALRELADH